MTTMANDLPPQGDRTPRGRREGGTVPAPLSSSSSDGLPGVSVTSTPGKPAIVTGANAPVPFGEDLRSVEELRQELRFCQRQALSAARILLGREGDEDGSLSLLERMEIALFRLELVHGRNFGWIGAYPPRAKSKGVQTEETSSAPQQSGGGGVTSRSGGGAASEVSGPSAQKATARGSSPLSGEKTTPEGGRKQKGKPSRGNPSAARSSPPVGKSVRAGQGAGGKTAKSPRSPNSAPPLGGASGGGGSLSGGRPARVKPVRGLSSSGYFVAPPSGGEVGGGGSVSGGRPVRVTPSPGSSSPSSVEGSAGGNPSSEGPPQLTIVVRVEEGGSSSPASAALSRCVAEFLRGGAEGPRSTGQSCGPWRGVQLRLAVVRVRGRFCGGGSPPMLPLSRARPHAVEVPQQ